MNRIDRIGNPLPGGGLEVHAGEADGRVAPDVDAEVVRPGELGAHGQAEPVAELGGLAPAEVGERRGRLPERRHLVAGAAGVVGDDGLLLVDHSVQLGDHPVRIDRGRRRWRAWAAHSAEPGLAQLGDPLRHVAAALGARCGRAPPSPG